MLLWYLFLLTWWLSFFGVRGDEGFVCVCVCVCGCRGFRRLVGFDFGGFVGSASGVMGAYRMMMVHLYIR